MNPGRAPFMQTGRGIPTPFMQTNISTGEKLVKLKSGEIVKEKTITKTTPGSEGTPGIPGTAPVTIKGKAATPATSATKGNKGGPEFDKAYGAAVKAGKGTFSFGGKSFNTEKSLPTKAKPGTPGTPDITLPGKAATPSTPGTPASISSQISVEKIPSKVSSIEVSRGFIPGAGNENVTRTRGTVVADENKIKAIKEGVESKNAEIAATYAPSNYYGTSSPKAIASNEKRNAKLAARVKNLTRTVSTGEIGTNLGLEAKTARSERNDQRSELVNKNEASYNESHYEPAPKQLRKQVAKKKSPAKQMETINKIVSKAKEVGSKIVGGIKRMDKALEGNSDTRSFNAKDTVLGRRAVGAQAGKKVSAAPQLKSVAKKKMAGKKAPAKMKKC